MSEEYLSSPAQEPADYQAAQTQAVFFSWPARTLIEVSGRDAASFLHNLCTNDIRNLRVGQSCEAFFTTAKGRTLAHVFLSRLSGPGGEFFWLDTVAGQAEKLCRHLEHYLISEEVDIRDRSSEVTQGYLCGPAAPGFQEGGLVETALQSPTACVGLRRDHLGLPGYQLFGPAAQLAAVRQRLLVAGVRPAGPDLYEVLRIEAGFPEWGRELDDNRFVMEVGRAAQAISYTKGCYLGQEAVVMARDRGQVKRLLLGLKWKGPAASAGARVYHDTQEVGQVTSSIWSPGHQAALALAYLQRGFWEAGAPLAVAVGAARCPAVVQPLPFPRSNDAGTPAGAGTPH